MILKLFHHGVENVFPPLESGFGYVTGFDQWNISKCDTSRDIKTIH